MIYIKRSVDFKKDVTWVAANLDEETRRNHNLYLGTDVNGAIAAAVKAGMSKEDAVAGAEKEIERCKNEIIDEIKPGKPSWR